ncbi:MAG TPA: glycosyltransferase family 39 protein [Mycobacteriales bacterium]|nr:glycosyltransferase family 39 protein [Mycobacteriales bacterium]
MAVLTGLGLLAVSARYGYHRDELYFLACGRHLAWGYPDQPPLVPLLAHAMSSINPHSLVVLRLPSDLSVAATCVLTAVIARELGADRRGQTFAALAIAISSITLASGHLLSTTTFGLTSWAAFFAVTLHALRTHDGRWWLLAGVVVGLGLLDNDLVLVLATATIVGVLICGPRRVLLSPWLWCGAAVAIALWTPYLIWQAHHGWPQLAISRAIARGSSGTSAPRWQIPVQQLFLASPPLVPVWVVGLVRLGRSPALRRCRAFAVAYAVVFLAVLVTGGKPYYVALAFPLLLAAGAQPAVDWASQQRERLRTWTIVIAVTAVIDALITLPLIPVDELHATPIEAMNYDAGETVGWPTLAAQMDRALRRAGPDAVLVTSNYGEAGAVQRYYPRDAHRVYAVQNAYWLWGPPPDRTEAVVAVGFDPVRLSPYFRSVSLVALLDNHHGVDDDEQHASVRLCHGPTLPWPQLWPHLKTYG